MPRDLPAQCLTVAHGDPLAALALAIRMTRLKLIAAGRMRPAPDERLPLAVRHARAGR